ncbi:MAG TPA: hypothetical protein VND93_10425 [Myxococcales bacterium]|nr:hypothetical protein [Myxococcales bacterium]
MDLRPLGMGELVDRSASLWRRNVGGLFKIHLGFALALYALAKGLLLGIARWAPLFRGGAAMATALNQRSGEMERQLPVMLGMSGAFFLAYTWVNWQGWVAASDYAIGAWLGRPVSVEGSLRRALRRTGASTGALVIATLYAVAAITVLMLPGMAAIVLVAVVAPGPAAAAVLAAGGAALIGFGMLAAMVWCLLRFLFTCQVLAMEDVGGLQAIRRSGALISGRVGPGFFGWVKVRATVLVTVVALLVFTVLIVSGLPAMVVQGVYGNAFDPLHATPDAVPQALLVPAELLQVVVQSLFSPLYIVFAGLFYADMRVRREGLDLELALDREEKA